MLRQTYDFKHKIWLHKKTTIMVEQYKYEINTLSKKKLKSLYQIQKAFLKQEKDENINIEITIQSFNLYR